jgi:hypothetical protein
MQAIKPVQTSFTPWSRVESLVERRARRSLRPPRSPPAESDGAARVESTTNSKAALGRRRPRHARGRSGRHLCRSRHAQRPPSVSSASRQRRAPIRRGPAARLTREHSVRNGHETQKSEWRRSFVQWTASGRPQRDVSGRAERSGSANGGAGTGMRRGAPLLRRLESIRLLSSSSGLGRSDIASCLAARRDGSGPRSRWRCRLEVRQAGRQRTTDNEQRRGAADRKTRTHHAIKIVSPGNTVSQVLLAVSAGLLLEHVLALEYPRRLSQISIRS